MFMYSPVADPGGTGAACSLAVSVATNVKSNHPSFVLNRRNTVERVKHFSKIQI